jgi:hypothetical protein
VVVQDCDRCLRIFGGRSGRTATSLDTLPTGDTSPKRAYLDSSGNRIVSAASRELGGIGIGTDIDTACEPDLGLRKTDRPVSMTQQVILNLLTTKNRSFVKLQLWPTPLRRMHAVGIVILAGLECSFYSLVSKP